MQHYNKSLLLDNFFVIFFFSEKELITAPLDGLVLPGITRKSLIELAKKWVRSIRARDEYQVKFILIITIATINLTFSLV